MKTKILENYGEEKREARGECYRALKEAEALGRAHEFAHDKVARGLSCMRSASAASTSTRQSQYLHRQLVPHEQQRRLAQRPHLHCAKPPAQEQQRLAEQLDSQTSSRRSPAKEKTSSEAVAGESTVCVLTRSLAGTNSSTLNSCSATLASGPLHAISLRYVCDTSQSHQNQMQKESTNLRLVGNLLLENHLEMAQVVGVDAAQETQTKSARGGKSSSPFEDA